MSADNYHYIQKDGHRYDVGMAFMSDYCVLERHPVPAVHHHKFDTLQAAMEFADAEWTEYGMWLSPECEAEIDAENASPPPAGQLDTGSQ